MSVYEYMNIIYIYIYIYMYIVTSGRGGWGSVQLTTNQISNGIQTVVMGTSWGPSQTV